MADEQGFTAPLRQTASRVVIVLPFDPDQAWGPRPRHHLAGTVGGHPWRGPVEQDGEQFVLALGPAWRREHGVRVGQEAEVVLAPEGPQLADMGPDGAAALRAAPQARAFFEGLPSFYRKNYLRWIDGARRPATRAARIAEMVRLLGEGRRERQGRPRGTGGTP